MKPAIKLKAHDDASAPNILVEPKRAPAPNTMLSAKQAARESVRDADKPCGFPADNTVKQVQPREEMMQPAADEVPKGVLDAVRSVILHQLTREEHLILVLRYVEQMTEGEIAQVLGLGTHAVSRTLERISTLMEESLPAS